MEIVGIKEGFNCRIISRGVCVEEEKDLMAVCGKRGHKVGEVIENLLAWVGGFDTASA
jgi:hypothetical protein